MSPHVRLKVIDFYCNFTSRGTATSNVFSAVQNSSPALVINVCFIDWSAGKPWRRAERATKRDRRRGNGANHLHRRRLDLITTLSALLPGAVSSSPLLAFEQQSRLTFSLLPSATHSHRLAICFNFFRGLQFRTDTRILGGRIEGESAALPPVVCCLIDRPTHSEIIFHFTWAAPRRTGTAARTK